MKIFRKVITKVRLALSLLESTRITDKLGLPLDPKIKRTVAVLRMLGFTTDASCEGHKDYHNPLGATDIEKWGRYDKEDQICYPWIDLDWSHPPTEEMLKQRAELQFLVQDYNDPRIFVEQRTHFLTLRTKCSSLEEGQQVMSDFTEWLLNNEISSSN